jgi:benzil reductase ((S)-benzoin forming)
MNYFFITGTSRGIGKALCECLTENADNRIFGFSRSKVSFNRNYKHLEIDFSMPQAFSQFVFPELPDAEQIVLINNAGALGEVKRIGKRTSEDIIGNYTVNIIAPSILMNSFATVYQNLTCRRTIINISSGAGRHAVEAWSTYCASKAAVDMMSEVFKTEQNHLPVENQISVFSLAPGIVDTQMQEQIRAVDSYDFSEKERFVSYKNQNLLWSPAKVSNYVINIIENPKKYSETLLDVRKMEL